MSTSVSSGPQGPEGDPKKVDEARAVIVQTNGHDKAKHSFARSALIVSIISALISLFSMAMSGLNFYYSLYKAAAAEIAIGPQVFFSSTPQIGAWFTVANTGGSPTTLTSAKLDWDAPHAAFDATMNSSSLDEWYYAETNQRQVSTSTRYTWFHPIPLVGHADTSTLLWFTTSTRNFKFIPGDHTFTVTFFNADRKLGQAQFRVTLAESDIRNMTAFTELPIDVK